MRKSPVTRERQLGIYLGLGYVIALPNIKISVNQYLSKLGDIHGCVVLSWCDDKREVSFPRPRCHIRQQER